MKVLGGLHKSGKKQQEQWQVNTSKICMKKGEKCVKQNNQYKNSKILYKVNRWKRKSKLVGESNTKQARLEYGKVALDVKPYVETVLY